MSDNRQVCDGQTEEPASPLVLLGDCWPPIIKSVREYLVVSDVDLNLLRFASSPEQAVQAVKTGLQEKQTRPGPYG